jgi:hypothetical protein
MNRTSKIVVAVLGISIVASVAGTVIWWRTSADKMFDDMKVARKAGEVMGRTMTESGCLTATLDEQKTNPKNAFNIVAQMTRTMQFEGCLKTSKIEDKFCDGVPPADKVLQFGVWANAVCVQHGVLDQQCGQSLQPVVMYCSFDRKDKIQRAAKQKIDQ